MITKSMGDIMVLYPERVQFSGTPLISDYEFEFRIVINLTLQLLT